MYLLIRRRAALRVLAAPGGMRLPSGKQIRIIPNFIQKSRDNPGIITFENTVVSKVG